VVNGLVTNDVVGLTPGQGCYAVALTPKGKIVADLRVFRTADAVLTDATSAAGPGWFALVKKFVNPRLAKYADETSQFAFLELYGPGTRELLMRFGVNVDVPWAHTAIELGGIEVQVAALPEGGAVAWCAADAMDTARTAIVRGGAGVGGEADLEVARIEAGRPRWGIDMDDTMLAQEANMDDLGAISYTKGCYTGQEFVARLHYRGHVNKSLRGLRLSAPAARGATLVTGEGAKVGEVRSSVVSPREGPIALAMLRREVPDGATVTAQTDEAAVTATVVSLPFAR
jgi:folate-binding protein YgfZ